MVFACACVCLYMHGCVMCYVCALFELTSVTHPLCTLVYMVFSVCGCACVFYVHVCVFFFFCVCVCACAWATVFVYVRKS